jgi:hypothetical protein
MTPAWPVVAILALIGTVVAWVWFLVSVVEGWVR